MSKLGDRMGTKLGPSARSILDAGRDGDNPTAADRARVKRALMRTIAATTVVGATSAAGSAGAAGAAGGGATAVALAAKGTSLSLGIKLFGVAVLALATFGGVMLQRASSPDPAVIQAASSNTAAPAVESANKAPAPVDPSSAEPAKVAVAVPARADEPAPAEQAKAVPAQARSRVVANEPVDRADPEPDAPVAVASPAQPAIAEEDPLAAETRRLREAHGALQAGDAQRALGLLGEQGGQLGEERAAARVLALCQLGKIAEMEAARAAFLREHPHSPLEGRVRGGCAPSITNTNPNPNTK